jgi:hypothetical protein
MYRALLLFIDCPRDSLILTETLKMPELQARALSVLRAVYPSR